jgi:hypothetical protein
VKADGSILDALSPFFRSRTWKPFPFKRKLWAACLSAHSGLLHASAGLGKPLAAHLGPVAEAHAEFGPPTPLPHPLETSGSASQSRPSSPSKSNASPDPGASAPLWHVKAPNNSPRQTPPFSLPTPARRPKSGSKPSAKCGPCGVAEAADSDRFDSSLIASPYPLRPQSSDENTAPNLESLVCRGG